MPKMRFLNGTVQTFVVYAEDVRKGDYIANVGRVVAVSEVEAMFVNITVDRPVWIGGACEYDTDNLLRHIVDEVTITGKGGCLT